MSRLSELAMLVVSLVVLATIGIASYRSSRDAEAANRESGISREISISASELLSTLKDAETGQRGYLLTSRDIYLEPFARASSRAGEILARLATQAESRTDQKQRTRELGPVVAAKLAELRATIDLQRQGHAAVAQAVVDTDQGKALMDDIRRRCEQIIAAARSREAGYRADAEASTQRLRLVSTGGSLLLFVFLAISAVAIFRGTSRREALLEEVSAGKKLLATTLSSIGDAVITTDAKARITFMNPVAQTLSGWTEAEAIGRNLAEVFRIVNEISRLTVESPIDKALALGIVVGLANHTDLLAKDGREVPIDDSAAPIRDSKGQIIGAVLVFRDISERRRSDTALKAVARELERSNEELQQFAYAASHDLRAPLRSVHTIAQLLARRFEEQLGEDGGEMIAHITEGLSRAMSLMTDLLNFAKAGSQDVAAATSADMARALDAVLVVLQDEIAAAGAKVTYDALPEVRATETLAEQLLQNLIGNALKYRSAQPPEIHVGATRQDGDWLFSVRDNGMGINAEHACDIFKPFKRLHGDEIPGSGIGLATCQKIVTGYGGRIWVESTPGKGSTFFFTLPAITG